MLKLIGAENIVEINKSHIEFIECVDGVHTIYFHSGRTISFKIPGFSDTSAVLKQSILNVEFV